MGEWPFKPGEPRHWTDETEAQAAGCEVPASNECGSCGGSGVFVFSNGTTADCTNCSTTGRIG